MVSADEAPVEGPRLSEPVGSWLVPEAGVDVEVGVGAGDGELELGGLDELGPVVGDVDVDGGAVCVLVLGLGLALALLLGVPCPGGRREGTPEEMLVPHLVELEPLGVAAGPEAGLTGLCAVDCSPRLLPLP